MVRRGRQRLADCNHPGIIQQFVTVDCQSPERAVDVSAQVVIPDAVEQPREQVFAVPRFVEAFKGGVDDRDAFPHLRADLWSGVGRVIVQNEDPFAKR